MANAAEFLARWKVRYIDAEGRILEELDTTIAECVEDANEEGFSREDLDQAAGGELKAYIREAIAKAQGKYTSGDVARPRLWCLFPVSARGACVLPPGTSCCLPRMLPRIHRRAESSCPTWRRLAAFRNYRECHRRRSCTRLSPLH
jgi:hypothetical protein